MRQLFRWIKKRSTKILFGGLTALVVYLSLGFYNNLKENVFFLLGFAILTAAVLFLFFTDFFKTRYEDEK